MSIQPKPNTSRIESLSIIVEPDEILVDGLPDRRLLATAVALPGRVDAELTIEEQAAENDNMKGEFFEEPDDVPNDDDAPLRMATLTFSTRAYGLGDLSAGVLHPDGYWLYWLLGSGLADQGSRITEVSDAVAAGLSATTFTATNGGSYAAGKPFRVTIGGLPFYGRVEAVDGATITHSELVSRTRVSGVADTVAAAIDTENFTASDGTLYALADVLRSPAGELVAVTGVNGNDITHEALNTAFAPGDAIEIIRNGRVQAEDGRRFQVGGIIRVDLGAGEEDAAITAVNGDVVTHDALSVALSSEQAVSVVEPVPTDATVYVCTTTVSDVLVAADATTAQVTTPARFQKHDVWKVTKNGLTEYISVDAISADGITITYSGLPDGVTLSAGDTLRRCRRFENRVEQGPTIAAVYDRQNERHELWRGRLTQITTSGSTASGERRIVLEFTVRFLWVNPVHDNADPRPAVRHRGAVAHFDRSRLALSQDAPSLASVAADLHVSAYSATVTRPAEPGGSSLSVLGASGQDTVMGTAMLESTLSTPVKLLDLDYQKAPSPVLRRALFGCGPKLDGAGLALMLRRAHMTSSAQLRATQNERRVQELAFRAGANGVGAGSSFALALAE